ncbi:MAG: glycine oxidase ThiO [Bryobacterales bacterium]|nr:glycine oxidase ThiO [Bryobacterales bacterium]
MASAQPSADVLIIGSGIVGAALAWRLAQRGVHVTIVEARQWGGEASWAGAGMLVPGSEYETASDHMRFALQSLSLYPSFVRELSEASGRPIDFTACGSLELAATEAELASIAHRAARQAELGVRAELVSPSHLQRLIPGIEPHLAGGYLYPAEGQVDPRTVMAALRIACGRAGATVIEGEPVVALEWDRASLYASMGSGKVRKARCGVLAAGAWASQLGKYLPPVYPVKGHLIGYPMDPGSLPHVLRYHHTYVVQRQSGYTIAGTNEERSGYDRAVNPDACLEIAARARKLWSLLPERPADTWIGFRPGVDSEGPHLGRWKDSPLWLAYGHYRNGILLAPATAERLSLHILASL